jgi:hypothetical protein
MVGGQHNSGTKTQHMLPVLRKSPLAYLFQKEENPQTGQKIIHVRRTNVSIYIVMYTTRFCYISIISTHDRNM